jgi:hypothetical protein
VPQLAGEVGRGGVGAAQPQLQRAGVRHHGDGIHTGRAGDGILCAPRGRNHTTDGLRRRAGRDDRRSRVANYTKLSLLILVETVARMWGLNSSEISELINLLDRAASDRH